MNPKQRKLLVIGALGVAGLAMASLTFLGLEQNLVYYWNPTELKEAGAKAVGATIRLGGLVVEDSINMDGDGLGLDFRITDGTNEMPIRVDSVPPAMFREGIGVVVEGTVDAGGHFKADQLLVKHDNEYRAPESERKADVEDLVKTMNMEPSQ